MTAELVLLLAVYGMLIMGLFVSDFGLAQTFKESLPRLSARIEKNIACGQGFWADSGMKWQKPAAKPSYDDNLWGL